VDDAGAGFASLRHILELDPAFVKLDISLIRGIDRDPAKQALVVGMRHFARTTKCRLIAEGVETEAEAQTLTELDVRLVQGYLLGRPAALSPLATENAGINR
jgi:EAL domain-containing protein (putative c-di-GMP-specific phosphodiesterase class I)